MVLSMGRFHLVLAVVSVTALLAGCGDDNQAPVLEPASTSSTSPTSAPSTDAIDDGAGPTDPTSETDEPIDDDAAGGTTSTAAPDATVTTTSERRDPGDPDYPTTQPSPPATYPVTGD